MSIRSLNIISKKELLWVANPEFPSKVSGFQIWPFGCTSLLLIMIPLSRLIHAPGAKILSLQGSYSNVSVTCLVSLRSRTSQNRCVSKTIKQTHKYLTSLWLTIQSIREGCPLPPVLTASALPPPFFPSAKYFSCQFPVRICSQLLILLQAIYILSLESNHS